MKEFTIKININDHGVGKIIARRAGISSCALSRIRNRKMKVSPELAITLEDVTGIRREAWILPDKYFNPFLKRKESKNERTICKET